MSSKFMFDYNLTGLMCILHEDVCTISRWIILRMIHEDHVCVNVIKHRVSVYYMHNKACKYQKLTKSVFSNRGYTSFST